MARTHHHGDKKKAKLFNPWFWVRQTPSWWVTKVMTRPQRRQAHTWERKTATTGVQALDGVDSPPHGKKPHIYFW